MKVAQPPARELTSEVITWTMNTNACLHRTVFSQNFVGNIISYIIIYLALVSSLYSSICMRNKLYMWVVAAGPGNVNCCKFSCWQQVRVHLHFENLKGVRLGYFKQFESDLFQRPLVKAIQWCERYFRVGGGGGLHDNLIWNFFASISHSKMRVCILTR